MKIEQGIIDDIINIIETELEYPTPNPDRICSIMATIEKEIENGNTDPYHPLQVALQVAVSQTKKSIIKRINEYLKNRVVD